MRIAVLIAVFLCGLRVSAQPALHLIPYPKEVKIAAARLALDGAISVVSDAHSAAADELLAFLRAQGLTAVVGGSGSGAVRIRLTRKGADRTLGEEGYGLTVGPAEVVIRAFGEAGLYYGVVTLMQLLRGDASLPFGQIKDWPDTRVRAAHYDTKHHQDTKEYVQSFIRDLSHYKVNMLIWEWEDKFAYPSHPEIGAPGAFTMQEMQELTRYARRYHVQIVPLVQGLGHASFILKWPQYAHLREVPASNFEFCPLKDSTYLLLNDLWRDALEATPGSKYIHIGSDETYELGACALCRQKDSAIGRSGLYHLFLSRAAGSLQARGRQVMAWESPMGWEKERLKVYSGSMRQERAVTPQKGLVLTESYDYETKDLAYARKAKSLGYPVMAYDPNPGIEQLFLPYFFSKDGKGQTQKGSLESSYKFLRDNAGKGVFDGMIRTSWDDSGLPMESWMLQFILSAGYSWNANGPSLERFTGDFFAERYGDRVTGMDSLYRWLNEGAYFYMESFERRVWAWGEIGKTHLPDLPRGDALEYDPYWNTMYADRVAASRVMIARMDSAAGVCAQALAAGSAAGLRNRQEVEVLGTLVDLIRHTAQTYLDLSALEGEIKAAHEARFVNVDSAYAHLAEAERIVGGQLERRARVYGGLVKVWERERLPKGLSEPNKKYFFEQDRTRHFANRAPDMSYLIIDEQKLGLEAYQTKLQDYMRAFRTRFLSPQ